MNRVLSASPARRRENLDTEDLDPKRAADRGQLQYRARRGDLTARRMLAEATP